MVNETKIKTMTEIATYLEGKGKADIKMMKRFKFDYVSLNGFRVMLFATVGLVILFALDFLGKLMNQIESISEFDFIGQATVYLTLWVLCMIFYAVLSGRIYRKRYADAKKRIERYETLLAELEEETKR